MGPIQSFFQSALERIDRAFYQCEVCKDVSLWRFETCVIDGKSICRRCSKERGAIVHNGTELIPAGWHCNQHPHDELVQLIAAKITEVNERHARIQAAALQRQEQLERQQLLRMRAAAIKTHSENYQGKLPKPKLNKHIESDWQYDRLEAEIELKVQAVLHGCGHIQRVSFIKDDDGGYPYVRSMWKYSGII